MEKHSGAIKITDAVTHESIPIPSKRSFEPHKTLGHHKSPTNNKLDISQLQSKALRLSILIATSLVTRQGARLAYNTIFIPTIRYTLPQSFHTRTTLDAAQAAPHSMIIAKCGYNRKTASALIYAPTWYAGGGFLPKYLLQGEGMVLQF